MAEQPDDQRAAEPVALAVNPDTGIVHRRMSDGSWYALDVIPGRDAVADENLIRYFPQENATRCPRTWSLPDPPPDDVTVVHVQAASGEVFRCVREGHRWRDGSGRDLFRLHRRRLFGFGELLDMGKVVEGEAPAVEPPVLADEAGGSR